MKVGVLATMVFAISIGFPIASFAGLAPDADGDGIPDVLDKCTLDSRNATAPATCDTDVDGYGNVCDADFNQSKTTTSADFNQFFFPAFKGYDPSPWPQGMDQNCSNTVTSADFNQFFNPKFKGAPALGGGGPGPSGLSCAGTPGCS